MRLNRRQETAAPERLAQLSPARQARCAATASKPSREGCTKTRGSAREGPARPHPWVWRRAQRPIRDPPSAPLLAGAAAEFEEPDPASDVSVGGLVNARQPRLWSRRRRRRSPTLRGGARHRHQRGEKKGASAYPFSRTGSTTRNSDPRGHARRVRGRKSRRWQDRHARHSVFRDRPRPGPASEPRGCGQGDDINRATPSPSFAYPSMQRSSRGAAVRLPRPSRPDRPPVRPRWHRARGASRRGRCRTPRAGACRPCASCTGEARA